MQSVRLDRSFFYGSMQSYLRPTDAEAPSGHTQAGLRPGNVQEPLASRAVPHARLEVVASPRHGNPARSHTFLSEGHDNLETADAAGDAGTARTTAERFFGTKTLRQKRDTGSARLALCLSARFKGVVEICVTVNATLV